MKFLDEYRDPEAAKKLAEAIRRTVTRPWTIMEMCGGQTHTIVKYGVDRILPEGVELVHGPGCPVCVTSLEMIDRAHAIASRPEVIFCSFGDMLRVPGSRGDLLALKSRGSDIRVVYSPLDAVNLAAANPDKQVVFFAIGFETTAPPNAMSVWLAHKRGLKNFSVLVSHVLVPPSMTAILQSPENRVQGFLGPGHVCTVVGYGEYHSIAKEYGVPIVVTGFEPIDLFEGILMTLRQLEAGTAVVENQYGRAVRPDGNAASKKLIDEIFEICDRKWRGVGIIPKSGYKLRYEYRDHDAERKFEVEGIETQESSLCISGKILRGLKKPHDCTAFGKSCTPQSPLGATMVSSEGACAAYYAYGRHMEASRNHREHAELVQVGGRIVTMTERPPAVSFAPGELAAKVIRQSDEVVELKRRFFGENAEKIAECCAAMARAFDGGAHLLVFGNGGSSCDAAHMAVECTHPIIEKRPALPAISLATDTAVLTGIGNDQDFSLAFVQQLRLLGRRGDIAMGLSTSGKSANVNRALAAAREMGMLTVGYAGRDGGKMPPVCDFCFVVPSFSIPRIQETQETLLHIMWDLIHVVRGEEDVL